jgi:uncharacterized protein YecE (DUF72 family)
MDFGHVDDVSNLDVSLPDDDPITSRVLSSRGEPDADVRFGLPVWNRRDWVGPLYPRGTASRDYLRAFGKLFETVEVNSTFYHPVAPTLVQKWCEAVPPRFRFCPKVSRALTHEASFSPSALSAFVDSARAFGAQLGPCFLQLPPTADLSWKRALARLVEALAPEVPLAVELRHPAWFEAPTRERLFGWLREQGVGLVITDTPAHRNFVHMAVTAPFTLIRFRGASHPESDGARAKAWSERLARWIEGGLREAYFVTHTPADRELEGLWPIAQLAQGLVGNPGVRMVDSPKPPAPRQLGLL